MSTSATNGTHYAEVGKAKEVDACSQRVNAILAIIFAAVYIGVAGNYYSKINNFEDRTRDNCTRTTEHHLSSVCENLNTWNWCAIAGALLPGLLNLIFASFMFFRYCSKKHQHETEAAANKNICNMMWETNNKLIKFLNIIILVILWATKATSTLVDGAQALETAATIFMWVVGLEMLFSLIIYAIVITCTICILTTGTVSACCQGCHQML